MTVHEMIKRMGGRSAVGRICGISRQAVTSWAATGRMPMSEWTGRTSHTAKIAAAALKQGTPFHPLELCAGAGQYMHPCTHEETTQNSM